MGFITCCVPFAQSAAEVIRPKGPNPIDVVVLYWNW